MFRDGVTYLSTSPIFNIVSALEQKGKIMFNPWSSFSKLLKLYVSLEALARVYKYLSQIQLSDWKNNLQIQNTSEIKTSLL